MPLQRSCLCELERLWLPSPSLPSWSQGRLQSVVSWECADSPGALRPHPSRHLLTQELRPHGHPLSNHAVRRDSYDHPLLAFLSPSGCYPLDLPHTSRCPAPLLGFVPLQRIRGAESTWLPSTGPNRSTTFRPQGFAPSRRLAPPPTFLRLSAKVTLVRFSLQGFPLSNRPRNLHPRVSPLGVSPSTWPLPA